MSYQYQQFDDYQQLPHQEFYDPTYGIYYHNQYDSQGAAGVDYTHYYQYYGPQYQPNQYSVNPSFPGYDQPYPQTVLNDVGIGQQRPHSYRQNRPRGRGAWVYANEQRQYSRGGHFQQFPCWNSSAQTSGNIPGPNQQFSNRNTSRSSSLQSYGLSPQESENLSSGHRSSIDKFVNNQQSGYNQNFNGAQRPTFSADYLRRDFSSNQIPDKQKQTRQKTVNNVENSREESSTSCDIQKSVASATVSLDGLELRGGVQKNEGQLARIESTGNHVVERSSVSDRIYHKRNPVKTSHNIRQGVKAKHGNEDESQRGTLIDQLSRGRYECMVCCDNIRCDTAVWSCGNCFHVFHLRCIKKWARSPTAVEANGTGWRCPACQNVTEKVPNQYRCFCGHVRDPMYSRFETAHSCGELCNRKRKGDCPHLCTLLCHPGPCPPCSAMVTRFCDCGKSKQTRRCGTTSGFKCEGVCDKLLNCGKHTCTVVCHSGNCQSCDKKFMQGCFGGHVEREVICGSEEAQAVSFGCSQICKKSLNCGNHHCDQPCHPGECGTCLLMPGSMTHCPCGQMELKHIDHAPRKSCLDPVPTCQKVCNKLLTCGPKESPHQCQEMCHNGPCGPCQGKTTLQCSCGSVEREFLCVELSQFADKPFRCDKRCNIKRSCGRHKCGDTCCTKEEHFCEFICGKKLKCRIHKCEDVCHKGNCLPCFQASFEELSCHCGTEVIFPPVPCGTKPPECRKTCVRQHPCFHPVRHTCHSDDQCPPCTELTEKMCMGGHEMRKNIPCHLSDISCGLPCGKILPCKQHKCLRTCHKGDCLQDGEKCSQPCTKLREQCSHICASSCHPDSPCPKVACKAEVTLRCSCGRKSSKSSCQLGGAASANMSDFQKMTVHQLVSGQTVDVGQLTSFQKGSFRILECDAECAIVERNRRIALALEIKNPSLSSKLGSPTYTDFLKDFAKKNLQFVSGVEKSLSDLIQMTKQSKHANRSHAFAAMNRDQRRLVHELAEFYGCETQSYDYEPKKNVVATAHRDKCWLPSVTLTALIQRELHPKAPPPIPHVHRPADLRQAAQASKQSTSVIDDSSRSSTSIDYFDFSTK